MNGREILQHFADRLSDLHHSLPRPHPVLRFSSPPSSPREFDLLRTSYEGSPAVFPASWIPSWETALGVSCLSSGLAKLLGDIVEVDVFRLQYETDIADLCNQTVPSADSRRESNACRQACRSIHLSDTADVLPVRKDLGCSGSVAQAQETSTDDGFRLSASRSLYPIPMRSTETLEFGNFCSESSSLMEQRKTQLMYLTWRSLPDNFTTTSMPQEFCCFIEKIVHPVTTPEFIVRDSIKQRNLWMGSLVTSRIHFDALDNVHVCLSGRKVVHLYSPLELPNLYPEPWKEGALNNFSSIGSAFLANQNLHPLYYHSVKHFWAEVNSGEAIFIPAGWWHEVFTLQETISMNVWFGPSSNALFRPTLLHLKSENYLNFMLEHSKARGI